MKKLKEPVSMRKILRNRILGSVLIYRGVNALGRGTIMTFLPLFAVQTMGISTTAIGLILSVGIFLNAFLQVPMGVLADRFNKKALLIGGGLIAAVGYFYMIITSGVVDIFAARMIIAIGSALSLPAVTAIVAEEGRDLGAGSTVGVFNTAMSLGQIIGPVFSGYLLDVYGIGSVFSFSGIVSVLSVIAFWLFARE